MGHRSGYIKSSVRGRKRHVVTPLSQRRDLVTALHTHAYSQTNVVTKLSTNQMATGWNVKSITLNVGMSIVCALHLGVKGGTKWSLCLALFFSSRRILLKTLIEKNNN